MVCYIHWLLNLFFDLVVVYFLYPPENLHGHIFQPKPVARTRGSHLSLGMADAPNLDGIAAEWDACDMVREHMRVKGCLFAPALRCAVPELTVSCGERNYEVLVPLVKRLRLPNDEVSQVTVPAVAKQSFLSNLVLCRSFLVWFLSC